MEEAPGLEPSGLNWGDPAQLQYANVLGLIPGPFDLMIVFGHEDGTTRGPDGGGSTKREVARIAMSWAHAKSMIPLLARLVADYESQFGEVPAPGFDQMWKR